jgi:GAF domain-containing protein
VSAPPANVFSKPPQSSPAPAPTSTPARGRGRTATDEQDARLVKAFEASQDLFFLSTPVEGLEFATRLLKELVPYEAASACLYDINTDEFRFVTLDGAGAEQRQGEAVPNNVGILGTASRRIAEALIVEDATMDERFDPGVDGRVGLEARSLLYMPVNHQGRLLGMLQLINRDGRPSFSTADGDVVAYVAKQLGEFLHQHRIAPDRKSANR